MGDGVLSRWVAVRQMVTLYAEEAGYISLQTYYTDRSGEQVGRFDVSPTSISRWAPEDSEGSINLDLGTVTPDDEEEVEEEEADEDSDEDSDEEAEGPVETEELEDDSGDSENSPEAEEDAEAIDPVALLSSARAWLYSTCEDNTPAGETQRFRIRIHSLKGAKQLWSSILDYESGKTKPREPRKPVELTPYERKPLSEEEEDAPQEETYAGSPEERVLSEEEIAFSELLMNSHEEDDLLDFSDDIPRSATAAPDTIDFLDSAEPEVVTRKTTRRKRGPTVPKGAPSQAIQSLMHLHKSHKEFIDTVMATTKQLVKVQAGAMEQLSGGLGDARNRENDLIQVIQGLRLAEAESAVEAAKAQDASEVRSILGKEAISQMGLLGQVLLTRKAPTNGAPTNGVPTNGAPTNGALAAAPPPPELAEPVETGAHLYPDVSGGALRAVGEPSEQQIHDHEASMVSLLGWAEARPDVLEALNDPSVRAYLRNAENVDQLRGLAQMMSPASEELNPTDFPVETTPAEEIAVETESEVEPSDDSL